MNNKYKSMKNSYNYKYYKPYKKLYDDIKKIIINSYTIKTEIQLNKNEQILISSNDKLDIYISTKIDIYLNYKFIIFVIMYIIFIIYIDIYYIYKYYIKK
jgi:hypothetical protein